jgi:hypothetical protein
LNTLAKWSSTLPPDAKIVGSNTARAKGFKSFCIAISLNMHCYCVCLVKFTTKNAFKKIRTIDISIPLRNFHLAILRSKQQFGKVIFHLQLNNILANFNEIFAGKKWRNYLKIKTLTPGRAGPFSPAST